jgi:D-arabinose 1-dehydrogenase-like Zn-dependent alcohol dehydrogenase
VSVIGKDIERCAKGIQALAGDYCAGRNITADIELIRPDQIDEAMKRVVGKEARYRFVIHMTTA